MPRRNQNAGRRPLANNVRRRGISVYDFIDQYPTPASIRRERGHEELPRKRRRSRQKKGGSE